MFRLAPRGHVAAGDPLIPEGRRQHSGTVGVCFIRDVLVDASFARRAAMLLVIPLGRIAIALRMMLTCHSDAYGGQMHCRSAVEAQKSHPRVGREGEASRRAPFWAFRFRYAFRRRLIRKRVSCSALI